MAEAAAAPDEKPAETFEAVLEARVVKTVVASVMNTVLWTVSVLVNGAVVSPSSDDATTVEVSTTAVAEGSGVVPKKEVLLEISYEIKVLVEDAPMFSVEVNKVGPVARTVSVEVRVLVSA